MAFVSGGPAVLAQGSDGHRGFCVSSLQRAV